MSILIARPETIKEAIRSASERMIQGRITPDHERIRILKRVLDSGLPDYQTIERYKAKQ